MFTAFQFNCVLACDTDVVPGTGLCSAPAKLITGVFVKAAKWWLFCSEEKSVGLLISSSYAGS